MGKEEQDQDHLLQVWHGVPSSADIMDTQQDIQQWFDRQEAALDATASYELTTQLHEIGRAYPWLVRAYADSARVARDKPVINNKEKRSANDRFTIYMFGLLVSVGVASFFSTPLVFAIAGPFALLFLWLLVKGVRNS